MKSILFVTAACSALAIPAMAQEIPEDDVRIEERIVVTMPGPSREADELIGSAAVIERDEIVDRLEASLGDTLAREPGIASTYFGPAASRPVVRGLGAERVLVLTNSLGVIDASAASPDHQVSGDGIDATRIEILRGPAALAYGGQAIGGVVNVIDGLIAEEIPDAPRVDGLAAYTSVDEGTQLAGRAQAAFGPIVITLSGSARDGEDISIPGFAESAYLHALEEHDEDEDEDHEEEEEHSGSLENSFLETETLSAGISWIGENAFLGASVRRSTSLYGLPGHSHEHEHEDEDHEDEDEEEHEEEHEEGEESPFIDLSQTRYDVRGGLHFHGQTIDRVSAALSIVDYEHTEFEGPGEPGTVFTTTGHEARIEATHNPILGLEGTIGAQSSFKKLSAEGEEAFITPTKTEHFGIFLYEVREWDNDVGVEGGLRIDTTRIDNAVQGEQSFDTVSGSFGVHRHLDSGVFLGGQVAYTERAPSDTELFANGPHLATSQFEIGNANLEIERGLNFEGVMRIEFGAGTLGVSAYVTKFNDFIYLAPLGTEQDELPEFAFVQDAAAFRGFEVYGDFDVEDVLGADWALKASLDVVDGDLNSGGDVPFLPPVTLRADADGNWGRIGLGAGLTWAGDRDRAGTGGLRTDGYTLVDVRASYSLDGSGPLQSGSKLFIEVRNLGDEEARASTSVLKDVAPLPGRNVRAGIRVAF